ncbi:MAG: phosphatidylglycerophosphatase A [Pseudomonadota bacterium]
MRVIPKQKFHPYTILASFFFFGFSPIAPGTAGTFAACILVYFIQGLNIYFYLGFTLLVFIVGTFAAYKLDEMTNTKDNGVIVIDEVLGLLITMFLVPVTIVNLILAFFIFRFFDIVKLPPASTIDKNMKNAWGVMLDDAAAGVYSCAFLHLSIYIIRHYI